MSSFLIIWVFLFHNEHSFLCFCKAFHQLLETDTMDIRHVAVINNNMVESVEDQQPKQNHSLASPFWSLPFRTNENDLTGPTGLSHHESSPRTHHWRDFNHHEVYSGIRQSYPIGGGDPSQEAAKKARMSSKHQWCGVSHETRGSTRSIRPKE